MVKATADYLSNELSGLNRRPHEQLHAPGLRAFINSGNLPLRLVLLITELLAILAIARSDGAAVGATPALNWSDVWRSAMGECPSALSTCLPPW